MPTVEEMAKIKGYLVTYFRDLWNGSDLTSQVKRELASFCIDRGLALDDRGSYEMNAVHMAQVGVHFHKHHAALLEKMGALKIGRYISQHCCKDKFLEEITHNGGQHLLLHVELVLYQGGGGAAGSDDGAPPGFPQRPQASSMADAGSSSARRPPNDTARAPSPAGPASQPAAPQPPSDTWDVSPATPVPNKNTPNVRPSSTQRQPAHSDSQPQRAPRPYSAGASPSPAQAAPANQQHPRSASQGPTASGSRPAVRPTPVRPHSAPKAARSPSPAATNGAASKPSTSADNQQSAAEQEPQTLKTMTDWNAAFGEQPPRVAVAGTIQEDRMTLEFYTGSAAYLVHLPKPTPNTHIWPGLRGLLGNSDAPKVVHGCGALAAGLQRHYGIRLQHVLDVQVADGLAGYFRALASGSRGEDIPRRSLAALLQQHVPAAAGVEAAGETSNAYFLLELADALGAELGAAGTHTARALSSAAMQAASSSEPGGYNLASEFEVSFEDGRPSFSRLGAAAPAAPVSCRAGFGPGEGTAWMESVLRLLPGSREWGDLTTTRQLSHMHARDGSPLRICFRDGSSRVTLMSGLAKALRHLTAAVSPDTDLDTDALVAKLIPNGHFASGTSGGDSSQVGPSRLFERGSTVAIPGTLHSVAGILDAERRVLGLTYRIGRDLPGLARGFRDLLHDLSSSCSDQYDGPPRSLLLLGPAGAGKTTLLRSCAGCLARSFNRRVMALECPEDPWGPDSEVAPEVTRIPVPARAALPGALAEAAAAHRPQIMAVDGVAGAAGADALQQAADSGMCLLAALPCASLQALVASPQLSCLAGASCRGQPSGAAGWRAPPLFHAVVEVLGADRGFRVHRDAAASIDAILQGRPADAQVRKVHGERVTVRFETLGAAQAAGVVSKETAAGTGPDDGGQGWLQELLAMAGRS